MNVSTWFAQAQKALHHAQIATARLDCIVLLEDATGKDRTHLLAHPEIELSSSELNVLNEWVARRAKHKPLAYIRGKSEFYGREFIVSPAVLEPRPESETMIELLLQQTNLPTNVRIADIGTGSGALGITAKLELPEASVELIDVSDEALEVAKANVIKFATGSTVRKNDLLSQPTQHYDVLLCNLPYVPDDYPINDAARFEPKIALFAGPDGLDLYRKLFQQIATLSTKPLLILTESLPEQHDALEQIAEQASYTQQQEADFIQAFTVN